MGLAKEYQERIYARGFRGNDKSICLDHIQDPGLQRAVELYLAEQHCSFCGRVGSEQQPIAAPFEDFMSVVVGAINFFYGHANDEGVSWEDGDWVGAIVYESDEVVDELCGYGQVDDTVLDEVKRTILPESWVDRDFALLRPDRRMTFNWEQFCNLVKHEARFLFMSFPKRREFDPDELSPLELFQRIERIFQEVPGILRVIPAGSTIYRGRTFTGEPELSKYNAALLGPPPPRIATANRMSPAGISMFYGSDSIDTVIAEIGSHSSHRFAVVGAFVSAVDLHVVDLSAVPDLPSVFDRDAREHFYDIKFLRDFSESLAKPVDLDGAEHIDYVPTQVLTEYLRRGASFEANGILLRSSQDSGKNYVLFCDADACSDSASDRDRTWLTLEAGSVAAFRIVTVRAT